jgi:hypothetical protein
MKTRRGQFVISKNKLNNIAFDLICGKITFENLVIWDRLSVQYDEDTIALLDPEEKFFMVKMVGTEYSQRPSISLVDNYSGITNDAETYMLFLFDEMEFDIVLKPVNDHYVFAMFGFSNTFSTVNQKNAEFNIFGFSI